MEVWILLAAAGSGFLARHWQKNAHKANDPPPTVGASEEEKEGGGVTPSEGNNPNRSTSEDPLARRQRYRQFLSSDRKRSLGKEFSNPRPYIRTASKHPPPRTPRNSMDQPRTPGKLADSNDFEKAGRRNAASESDIATEELGSSQIPSDGLLCLDDGGGEEKRPPPTPLDNECGSWNLRERSLFSYKRSNNANKGHTEENERLETGIRGKRIKNGVDGMEKDSNRREHPSLFSGQRPNSANKGNTEENERFEIGIGGKRNKDENEKGSDNREEAILVGNLTSIFWDQSQIFFSEGLFDYSTEQRIGGMRSRSGSSSRRAKTPISRSRKSGGGSCPWKWKKSLPALAKPLSSLESCLSAQLLQDTEKREGKRRAQGYPLYQTSVSNGEKQALKVTCENNEVSLTDVRHEAGVSGNHTTTPGHLQHDIPFGLPSLPTPPQSHSLEVNVASTSVSANSTEARFQSTSNDSDKGIWFNFGVGVGMMFAISSNRNEVDILGESLGELEALLKNLERQFEASESKTYGDVKRGDDQRHNSAVSKVMSLSQSVRTITRSLTKIKYPKCTDSGDMPKLEAELEAELERMELNFHPGNISKANRICEIQANAESVRVQGESVVEGIPLETELGSEGSHSSEEEHHQMSNYAVSPHDLERRLYQVLESRLEERIAELEAELDNTATNLQMKEEQLESLQGIKNQSLQKTRPPAYSSSKDTCEGSVKESVERGFLFKSPNLCDLSISSESSSQSSRHDVESRAIPLNIPTVVGATNSSMKAPLFIALAGEALDAYNEACDEFLKVLSDSEDKLDNNSGDTLNLGNDMGFTIRDYSGQLEDCWGDTDLLLAHADQELPARCIRTRADSLCKNRDMSDPGSVSSSSRTESEQMPKARELFEDIACATTSGSTPCSIKLVDKNTHSLVWNEDSSNQGGVSTPVLSSGIEIIPSWNANNYLPSRNQGGSSSTMTSVRSKYFESGDANFNRIVGEAEDVSDSDEQMGKLLIKRIVEKTRKGSPIVQAAQTVLASLERADKPFHWN